MLRMLTFPGTSAALAALLSDETGTGAVVLANSPTLVTPNLGTPSAGTLTNCTGLPIGTGVSGLGTGVAAWLGTPNSSNLAAAVTNETGSGSLVFATSPTLVTPTLGAASGTSLTMGSGDVVDVYLAGDASVISQVGEIKHGSSGSPVTTLGPSLKVSRTDNLTEASIEAVGGAGADGAVNVAAIVGASKGLSTTEVQTVGVMGQAQTASTASAVGHDACGVYGVGRVTGSGTGTALGGFFAGRRDNDLSNTTGAEFHVANYGTAATTYSSSGFSSSALWMNCSGNADSAAAILVSNAFGRQFSVGLGFTAQVTGGKTGGVKDQTIRDDGNAATSLQINGTHSTAAISVAAGAGQLLLGGNSSVFGVSNNLLEIQGSNNSVDGLVVIGSTTNQKDYAVRVRNSAGQSRWGIVGTAGSYLTGTAVGDAVINTTSSGKFLHLGGTTKVISVGTANTLGFFAATPVSQPSAYTQTYATADKTHANFTSSDLTGITSSTTGSALAEPSAAYTQSEMQQNFRRIQDQQNNLKADVADLKQLVNSMIDDFQAMGLLA